MEAHPSNLVIKAALIFIACHRVVSAALLPIAAGHGKQRDGVLPIFFASMCPDTVPIKRTNACTIEELLISRSSQAAMENRCTALLLCENSGEIMGPVG